MNFILKLLFHFSIISTKFPPAEILLQKVIFKGSGYRSWFTTGGCGLMRGREHIFSFQCFVQITKYIGQVDAPSIGSIFNVGIKYDSSVQRDL